MSAALFGIKLHTYPDELAVVAIAVLMSRTVKFVADRIESFLSDSHAREAVANARLALDEAGRFLAFDVSAISGLGAYQSYPRGSVGEGLHMVQLVGSPYQYEAFRGHLRSVHQNKVPTGAYRGVGQPLGCTITECLVEHAARATGRDPAELRRLNYLAPDREVQKTPAGLSIGKLSLEKCLDKLLERVQYRTLRLETVAAAQAEHLSWAGIVHVRRADRRGLDVVWGEPCRGGGAGRLHRASRVNGYAVMS